MREIKFRGKRLDNGEWVCGYYIRRADQTHYIVTMQPNEYGKVEYPVIQVDPATVGQFTGVRDMNGEDIYEGDVVRVVHSFLLSFGEQFKNRKIRGAYDVELSKDDCGLTGVTYFRNYCVEVGKKMTWIGRNGSVQHELRTIFGGAEIIGNIHDNPELLNNE